MTHVLTCPAPNHTQIGETPTVFVVDDDARVRESLASLVLSAGWHPRTTPSAEEFLATQPTLAPSCLVTELQLPGLNGLELQRLVLDRAEMPVIFLSSCTDVRSSVQAMKAGALEYLIKPYVGDLLLHTLREALQRSQAALRLDSEMRALRNSYESLTMRERQVMALVVLGMLNKLAAAELGISENTVKAHRGQVMRKMKARSLPSLVAMADRLGLRRPAH